MTALRQRYAPARLRPATGLWRGEGRPLGWPALPVAGAVLLAIIAGVVAGASAKYAILGVLAIGFVVAVFVDLALGVAFFAAFSFLDQLSAGGLTVSFDKVAGLLLIVSWALRRSTSARGDARTILNRHPRIFAWVVVLLVWSLMSVAWAVAPGVAVSYVYRDILQLLLIPIVYGAVNSRRDVYVIVSGYLVGSLVSAVYGFLNPVSATAAAYGRTVGTIGDPNQQAAALVSGLCLAAGLGVVAARSRRLGALALVAGVMSLVGTVSTLSRSGLLALFFAMIAAAVIGGRWRARARVLVALAGIGIVGYFGLLAPASATSRVTSSNSDGRDTIWTVGLRMLEANPILGVGAGNFQQASARYLERPGFTRSAVFIIVTPTVAHNIYLEQAATLGVPGLVIMVAIFIGGIGATLRAAHIFERIGDRELDLLARACVLGMLAFLASDFFISGLQTKQFWVLFGLGLAMAKLAQTELAGTPAQPRR